MIQLRTLMLIAFAASNLAATAAEPSSAPATASAPETAAALRPASQPAVTAPPLAWLTDYAQALEQARQSNKPVLVRAGAVWCQWCKRLERELGDPRVRSELQRFTLVYVDVDHPPEQIESLAIGPVPALRVLTPNGRLQASHDGYMTADELAEWLKDKYQLAARLSPKPAGESETSAQTVDRLVGDLSRRDPATREVAIRRLMLLPKQSAGPVAKALANGDLATRLGVLEILQEWGAPIDGIDPWQPDTLTKDRLNRVAEWAAKPAQIPTSRPTSLTPSQLLAAQRDIAKLLDEKASLAEADAICERLARYGQLLLPEVYAALGNATSDRARERLTGLRYRLVATDELAFSWPGGLDRLCALDVDIRHQAVEELVRRASSADEALLLELFSDPDSLVREIALRALQKVSGAQASGALARLLKDPEPNVRAAVLKQLADSPSPALIPKVAEYVVSEQDADLVVHAVRVLRANPGSDSAGCLVSLLTHINWQVRAEAAEGLGEQISSQKLSSKVSRQAIDALTKALDDSDGFVVSVALKGLRNADAKVAEPLARAAEKHPELAADILAMLADNSDMQSKTVTYLRRFCTHAEPVVRAAAITSLCKAAPTNASKELAAALKDDSSRVRVAAATALLGIMNSQKPQQDEEAFIHVESRQSTSIFNLFIGRSYRKAATKPADSQPATQAVAEATTQPATQPAPAALADFSANNRWFEQFRSGSKRSKWMNELRSSLEAMLTAEAVDERLIAAAALISYGEDDRALPVLFAAIKARPESVSTAAGVLSWLPWSKRLQVFREFIGVAASPAVLAQVVESMAASSDPRAAEPLWAVFGDKMNSPDSAYQMLEALRHVYFGDFGYNAASAPLERRKQAIADARQHIQSGPELERVIALALLLNASLKDAAEQAARVVEDPQASAALRTDAFQVQLLASSRTAGRKLVSAALTGNDPVRQKMAVRFLAEGGSSLRTLRDGRIYLYFDNSAIDASESYRTGQAIAVPRAADVEPDVLRPLLQSPDPMIVAEAGYILATLKDPSGLNGLIEFWRSKDHGSEDILRGLVYRAISALNDDSRVPVLEEIYRSFSKTDYELRIFYWTIRSMNGPNAQDLRKKIRDEVGMDNLK